jgi:cellular nucleic acid-binding protein/protein lin-28
MSKKTGVVKWFNASKGFGFIIPDDGSEEIFVHQSHLKAEGFRSLRESEKVEFDVDDTEGEKTKAINVTGPGGANVLGSKRLYRKNKGGGGGGEKPTDNNQAAPESDGAANE